MTGIAHPLPSGTLLGVAAREARHGSPPSTAEVNRADRDRQARKGGTGLDTFPTIDASSAQRMIGIGRRHTVPGPTPVPVVVLHSEPKTIRPAPRARTRPT